ncbi:dehydrogenase/reductase SDR family member 7-like [Branchiostoma floridae x Branchiostoma japonicum]
MAAGSLALCPLAFGPLQQRAVQVFEQISAMLELLVSGVVLVLLVQLVRLLLSDGDLSLMWYERFGKSPGELAGKVVWITGASSGIGEALAVELSRVGVKLVLSARREDELRRVKETCLGTGKVSGDDVLVLPLDSVAFDTHAGCVEKVLAHFGRIDVLVNNSGRSQRSAFWQTSLAGDRHILELNVLGQVSLTKAVLPHMMERGEGQIMVTSSLSGFIPTPVGSAYSGSKFAIHGMFGALRAELVASSYDINILLACPGPVVSNVGKNSMAGEPDKTGTLDPTMDPMRDNDMPTARCARLLAVGMANRLDEIWVARHPYLTYAYISSYLPVPALARRMSTTFAKRRMKAIMEGKKKQ